MKTLIYEKKVYTLYMSLQDLIELMRKVDPSISRTLELHEVSITDNYQGGMVTVILHEKVEKFIKKEPPTNMKFITEMAGPVIEANSWDEALAQAKELNVKLVGEV